MAKNPKLSHLNRAKNARYWKVSLGRRGRIYDKKFHDLKYGGSRRALAAAIAWRDSLVAKLPSLSMPEFHAQKRSSNRSGVPGVHFLVKNAKRYDRAR